MTTPTPRKMILTVILLAVLCAANSPFGNNSLFAAVMGVEPLDNSFHEQVVRNETGKIDLTSSNSPKQFVYENDLVKIQIGYDQFLTYIERSLYKSQGDADAQRRLAELKRDAETRFSDRDYLLTDNQHLIADMLELGMARVYDKRNQLDVMTIEMKAYGFICGPLCGSGNRYFYLLNGMKFLEVNDWVM